MDFKSLFFGMIVFNLYFVSVASENSIITKLVCDEGSKIANHKLCTTCDFLTFGQDKLIDGYISYFCPMGMTPNDEKTFCCYDPLRQPFCCDAPTYVITGLLWILAVILAIYGVMKGIKFLIRVA